MSLPLSLSQCLLVACRRRCRRSPLASGSDAISRLQGEGCQEEAGRAAWQEGPSERAAHAHTCVCVYVHVHV